MCLELQTVSSLERCPLVRVSFIEKFHCWCIVLECAYLYTYKCLCIRKVLSAVNMTLRTSVTLQFYYMSPPSPSPSLSLPSLSLLVPLLSPLRQAQWHCTRSEILQVQTRTRCVCAPGEASPRHHLLTQPLTTAVRWSAAAVRKWCYRHQRQTKRKWSEFPWCPTSVFRRRQKLFRKEIVVKLWSISCICTCCTVHLLY